MKKLNNLVWISIATSCFFTACYDDVSYDKPSATPPITFSTPPPTVQDSSGIDNDTGLQTDASLSNSLKGTWLLTVKDRTFKNLTESSETNLSVNKAFPDQNFMVFIEGDNDFERTIEFCHDNTSSIKELVILNQKYRFRDITTFTNPYSDQLSEINTTYAFSFETDESNNQPVLKGNYLGESPNLTIKGNFSGEKISDERIHQFGEWTVTIDGERLNVTQNHCATYYVETTPTESHRLTLRTSGITQNSQEPIRLELGFKDVNLKTGQFSVDNKDYGVSQVYFRNKEYTLASGNIQLDNVDEYTLVGSLTDGLSEESIPISATWSFSPIDTKIPLETELLATFSQELTAKLLQIITADGQGDINLEDLVQGNVSNNQDLLEKLLMMFEDENGETNDLISFVTVSILQGDQSVNRIIDILGLDSELATPIREILQAFPSIVPDLIENPNAFSINYLLEIIDEERNNRDSTLLPSLLRVLVKYPGGVERLVSSPDVRAFLSPAAADMLVEYPDLTYAIFANFYLTENSDVILYIGPNPGLLDELAEQPELIEQIIADPNALNIIEQSFAYLYNLIRGIQTL